MKRRQATELRPHPVLPKPCLRVTTIRTPGRYVTRKVGSKVLYVHRCVYEETHGPIPDGFEIDHLCHTLDPTCPGELECLHRTCIEPTHLEAVTPAENKRRGRSPTAENGRQTHCFRGHEFTPENCYARPDGKSRRNCVTCARLREQARTERRRATAQARRDGYPEAIHDECRPYLVTR